MGLQMYLARHAESTGNSGEEASHINPRLTEMGLAQADLLGKRLAGGRFDAVITSPLTRTLQTAAAICPYLSYPTLFLWGDLMECGTEPSFPGLSLSEATALYPHVAPLFEGAIGKPLGKEDERLSFLRAHRVISYLEENYSPDAVFLLICHGTYNRYLLNAALGLPAEAIFFYGQTNTALNLVSIGQEDGRRKRRLHYLNDLSHLYQTEHMKGRAF